MENWTVDQVCNWLRQRNLGELVPKFREEEVSGAALLALNDRMVQQLVKKIGHQAVLMDLINKYQQHKSGPGAPTCCCETASPKLPEVLSGKNLKSFVARYKTLQWTSSYALPDFPYDIKCILAEKKSPDHSMRIRIIEFLQADMTKYLEGSLYPNSQQYNLVVSALLQAYPFLDADGNGFLLWKRALKDRFKYVRRPIADDEQVLRNKSKFGHRRGQTRRPPPAEHKLEHTQLQAEEDAVHPQGSALAAHIKWLKEEYLKAQRNWKEVDNRMKMTMEVRRKMISAKAPVQDILRLFPFLRCPCQLFREFQLLTHMDIHKKTAEILEVYSESILSLDVVRNNPITILLQEHLNQHTEADVLKSMKMTAACLLLPDVFGDDSSLFAAVNEEVRAVTPVLEVRNPFSVSGCEFVLQVGREQLAQLADCSMALAALLAAFQVFHIPCPSRIRRTLSFLHSLLFE
ncbi:SAMD3 protein, partial [Indicator maculatus]|nr:SAMD3 protein [Indicator maculatus]